MKYATYNPQTGLVTGHYSTEIHGDIIPAGAEPMTVAEWLDSCRGEIVRDQATGRWTKRPAPSSADQLATRKTVALFQLTDNRDAAIASGVDHAGHLWDSDERSRANLTATVAAVAAGIPLPAGFTWRTADNQDVALTSAELLALGAAMLAHVNTCYQRSWALKAEINAAASAAEIDAVVW
jgi:hypothetical protein